MTENLSLFGWPLPEPRDKAGRPEHEPTEENRNKVMLLVALKQPVKDIAAALGLTDKTLRKHYSAQLAQRRIARLQLDATVWAKLYENVLANDTSAIKEFTRRLDKHDVAELSANFGADTGRRRERAPAAPKRGKKEQAQHDAEQTLIDGGDWGEDLVPGSNGAN